MNKTKIDWCDMTWNPVTGCLNSCPYCYARKIAKRFCTNEHGKTGLLAAMAWAVRTGRQVIYHIEGSACYKLPDQTSSVRRGGWMRIFRWTGLNVFGGKI